MKVIFEYVDYQKYLNDWIHSRPKKGRGIKLALSKYLDITPQQVSKVLNENTHLTLDQAAKLITYLELSDVEGKYFLGLVELARAGSVELREIVQERLDLYSKNWEAPSSRIDIETRTPSIEDMQTYFSSYLYGAIELITYLEKYQTVESISQYFNISKKKTLKILNFLIELGPIKKQGEKFTSVGADYFKLPENINKMHIKNWRMRAMASLDYQDEVNLHQNINFVVKRQDIPEMKKHIFNSMVEMSEKYIIDAQGDTICSFCVDLFEIK